MNRNRPTYYATDPGQTLIVRDGRRQRRGLTLVKAKKLTKAAAKEGGKGAINHNYHNQIYMAT